MFSNGTRFMLSWRCWATIAAVAADGGTASLEAAAAPGELAAMTCGQAPLAAATSAAHEASPADVADDSALLDLDEAALRMAIEVLRMFIERRGCPLQSDECVLLTLPSQPM